MMTIALHATSAAEFRISFKILSAMTGLPFPD
jgi:hypothetical protein